MSSICCSSKNINSDSSKYNSAKCDIYVMCKFLSLEILNSHEAYAKRYLNQHHLFPKLLILFPANQFVTKAAIKRGLRAAREQSATTTRSRPQRFDESVGQQRE